MPITEENPSLRQILQDLTYPAEKWQITTCAEIYGGDVRTRRALYALPARVYSSPADVANALE
ncbi:MAG: DUF2795 domain-containing protein [Actinophytocola sp.]|uniref:DUF2795 domain-containing protein n=1 Tax=Actinophytocola sp. TaxID=1872138 RepID=UPI003C7420D7